MRSSRLAVRVGYLNQPTLDGRVIRTIANTGIVPVTNKLVSGGRDLVGHATLREPTHGDELVAELEVAPFVAALLLQYQRFIHLELVGGNIDRGDDGLVYLTDPRLSGLYVSEQRFGWAQPWAGQLDAVTA